jgi:hypothetical protein
VYYRIDLDATTNAYVSATAVPGPGATVSTGDGLRISVQDADGRLCSTDTVHFGPTRSPHPVTAGAARETGPGTYLCRKAGTYYVVVERRGASASGAGSEAPSSSDDWDLELDCTTEPALQEAAPTAAPETWDSASPDPVPGDPVGRTGGAGFATARALEQGVWQDTVRPGQTLFYKVPVDWGQQMHATAELGSTTGGDGFVGTALDLSLYNPVRDRVDDADTGYGGEQTTAALRPLPPVAYENRHATTDRVGAMRFAGWYYLAVHLGAPVAERFGDGPLGLTLRVRVSGTARSGPVYLGRSVPRDVFRVTAADRQEAEAGTSGGGSSGTGTDTGDGSGPPGGDPTMKWVAAGGLGAGSVLVLGLAGWTLLARRRPPARSG